jgi:hypothetical protein
MSEEDEWLISSQPGLTSSPFQIKDIRSAPSLVYIAPPEPPKGPSQPQGRMLSSQNRESVVAPEVARVSLGKHRISVSSLDQGDSSTQDVDTQLEREPMTQLFPAVDPLPFSGIRRQKVTSVRVGKIRVSPLSPLEFTEEQWKMTVENPNLGFGGTFRLIINMTDISWYKYHVVKKPFLFVIHTNHLISGVAADAYDPASKHRTNRTIAFEVSSRDTAHTLHQYVLSNYMRYLTPANTDIIPYKEVDKYFYG